MESLLLFRRALSSPTMCRFIPALSDHKSCAILAGMTTFWLCRLLAQFVAYDCAIWRGDRFRTFMHVACSLLWCYVSATYGIAFLTVRN